MVFALKLAVIELSVELDDDSISVVVESKFALMLLMLFSSVSTIFVAVVELRKLFAK